MKQQPQREQQPQPQQQKQQDNPDQTNNSTSDTRSSFYESGSNREPLFLPLPNHCLTFIDEKENSNSSRYKRLKCTMCKRNTHHRCLQCSKAYCKDCAFKKHIEMNPNFASASYTYP